MEFYREPRVVEAWQMNFSEESFGGYRQKKIVWW